MTRDAYSAIAISARQRIEEGWACTDAERALLLLVNDLSYALGQSLAIVPSLSNFAAALEVHKSTISRALRSALKKGYLLIVKRRDETLYGICMDTPADAAPAGAQESRESARQRLVELNENRLQGQADSNGQQRLPGIFESEELNAPAQAFAAMLQQDLQSSPATAVPVRSPERTSSAAPPVARVSSNDIESRLCRLQQSMDAARAGQQSAAIPSPPSTPPSRGGTFDHQWDEMSRSLTGDSLYALEQLREECRLAGPREEVAFYQWRFKWRKRVIEYPRVAAEAVGVCKAMRLEGNAPKQPGAFVFRTIQSAVGAMNGGP